MTTIDQLSAQQVARHAFNVFLFSGGHQTGAKLIYHALRLDETNAEALRCLSDLLDADGTKIFLAKWSWGFAKHKSGSPHPGQEAFADRSAFVVDEERYRAFLAQLVDPAGSLHGAFRAAHTLCGAMAGVYEEWLKTPTDELDALERARQEKSAPKKAWRKPWG